MHVTAVVAVVLLHTGVLHKLQFVVLQSKVTQDDANESLSAMHAQCD